MALNWQFDVLTMPALTEGTVYPLRAVKLGTAISGVVAATDGASSHGDRAMGIVQGNAGDSSIASGKNVDVMVLGVAKAYSGAAVVRGVLLKTDAAGKLITADTADDLVIGWAMTAASGADEVIEVFLTPSRI